MKPFRIAIIVFLLSSAVSLAAQSGARPDALAKYQPRRASESAGRTATANAEYEEAIRICQNEISQRIATRDTYTVMCWTLQRQKKYREVISWVDTGLRL